MNFFFSSFDHIENVNKCHECCSNSLLVALLKGYRQGYRSSKYNSVSFHSNITLTCTAKHSILHTSTSHGRQERLQTSTHGTRASKNTGNNHVAISDTPRQTTLTATFAAACIKYASLNTLLFLVAQIVARTTRESIAPCLAPASRSQRLLFFLLNHLTFCSSANVLSKVHKNLVGARAAVVKRKGDFARTYDSRRAIVPACITRRQRLAFAETLHCPVMVLTTPPPVRPLSLQGGSTNVFWRADGTKIWQL